MKKSILIHRNGDKGALGTQKGLTVIELMIAIAVGATLLGVALPSYSGLQHKNRVNSVASELHGSMNMARNVAIMDRESISVCPSTDGISCIASNVDWSQGWIVFKDMDRSGGPSESADIIKRVSSTHDQVDISSAGSGASYVTFSATGDARYTTGQFVVCHQGSSAKSRRLRISAVGRINFSERAQSDCTIESQGSGAAGDPPAPVG